MNHPYTIYLTLTKDEQGRVTLTCRGLVFRVETGKIIHLLPGGGYEEVSFVEMIRMVEEA